MLQTPRAWYPRAQSCVAMEFGRDQKNATMETLTMVTGARHAPWNVGGIQSARDLRAKYSVVMALLQETKSAMTATI
jgi:hypothetical protein